jgi:hypothetical protein
MLDGSLGDSEWGVAGGAERARGMAAGLRRGKGRGGGVGAILRVKEQRRSDEYVKPDP